MKTIVSLTVLGLAALWASPVLGKAEKGKAEKENMLAEMQKCAVCKHLAANPELMKNMIWETHKIDNGMLCLTTVPKGMKKEFDAASEKMHQAIAQVQADAKEGKQVELCSFCMSMGELMKMNVKQQHIETQTGSIHMFTSDDPDMVKKIHAMADKAIAVQKKMAKQQHQRIASLR